MVQGNYYIIFQKLTDENRQKEQKTIMYLTIKTTAHF